MYNGITLAHYALGALGAVLGYQRWPALGWTLGMAYLVFALAHIHVIMPLAVCPSCAHRRMQGARYVSAMNLVSARLVPPKDPADFSRRAAGVFCRNNLSLASLATPLLIMLPALGLAFSAVLLAVFLAVAALLAFRVFVVFPRVACGHCAPKGRCPNAQVVGLS